MHGFVDDQVENRWGGVCGMGLYVSLPNRLQVLQPRVTCPFLINLDVLPCTGGKTRSRACEKAPCMVCQLAAARGLESLALLKKIHLPPDTKAKKKKKKPPIRLCNKCFTPIYRGNHHTCNFKTRLANIRSDVNVSK